MLKPFDWASDGFTIESLIEGDERDFGAATKGLAEEGFIASQDADETPADVDADGAPVVPVKKRGK